MPSSTTARRVAAVLTALATTLAFAPSSAVGTPTALAASVVIQDRQGADAAYVTDDIDAHSMKIFTRANRGRQLQVHVTGPRLRIAEDSLNSYVLDISNGKRTRIYRVIWNFANDGDRFAGIRMWNHEDQRVSCIGMRGERVMKRTGLVLVLAVPRRCVGAPPLNRFKVQIVDVRRYSPTGIPQRGFIDALPKGLMYTQAL